MSVVLKREPMRRVVVGLFCGAWILMKVVPCAAREGWWLLRRMFWFEHK